jgi:hypothetical protein
VQLDHVAGAGEVCSPSTFCVMTPVSRPAVCSRATPRWPSFGSARAMTRQPRWLRAQYRRRAATEPVKAWNVIGVAGRAAPLGPR